MRKLILTLTLGWLIAANSGCAIPGYAGDPNRRCEEAIYTSENLSPLAGRVGAVLAARSA